MWTPLCPLPESLPAVSRPAACSPGRGVSSPGCSCPAPGAHQRDDLQGHQRRRPRVGSVTPEAGVTVQLFLPPAPTPIATEAVKGSRMAPTASRSSRPGTTRSRRSPKGRVQTGGIGGIAVDLTKAGQTVSGRNFDNFHASLYSTSTISDEDDISRLAGREGHPPVVAPAQRPAGRTRPPIHFPLSKPEMVEPVASAPPTAASAPRK